MNTGRFNIQLTPRATRPLSASQIAQQLRGPLGRLPGFQTFVNVPAALQIGGFQGNSSYNLMIQSLDTGDLYKWAPVLEKAVSELPEVQEVSNNMELRSPRIDLVIDRDKTAAVGLDATQIESALNDGLGPKWSTTIYGPRSQYRVLLELDPRYQEQAESLAASGSRRGAEPWCRSSRSSASRNRGTEQRESHGAASGRLDFVQPEARGFARHGRRPHNNVARRVLPPDVTTTFQGSAKVFQQSLSNLGLLLFIAIGVV
jgi:HAE1 family hydrophobic/amphiphilic exporter-1